MLATDVSRLADAETILWTVVDVVVIDVVVIDVVVIDVEVIDVIVIDVVVVELLYLIQINCSLDVRTKAMNGWRKIHPFLNLQMTMLALL